MSNGFGEWMKQQSDEDLQKITKALMLKWMDGLDVALARRVQEAGNRILDLPRPHPIEDCMAGLQRAVEQALGDVYRGLAFEIDPAKAAAFYAEAAVREAAKTVPADDVASAQQTSRFDKPADPA